MGFQSRVARWMDMHVDTHDIHAGIRGKGGLSHGKDLFRRRIVFELDASQLPLLEAAEERHGSKRAALVAALHAEAAIGELTERAEAAEAALAKAKGAAKGSAATKEKAAKKLEGDLEATKKELAARERALAKLRAEGEEAAEAQRGDLARAKAEVEELEAEIDELSERAVDRIFCNHCREWAEPEEWEWQRVKGGYYAFHSACGEHEPGGLRATSWLAQREG